MKMYKSTKDGKILMSDEEVKQLLAERELHKSAPKVITIDDRITELEKRVSKLEK